MITALKPYQPIDKGYPGPGLLAHVITSKMAHHLPLYRQEQIFHNLGIPLKRSVLSRWLKQSAEEFELLWDLMREKAMEGRIIFNDETSMPFILKGLGKTKTGSIWYFGGDDQHPYNIYEFAETGSGDTVEKFLAGFFGVVLTDGTNKLDDFFKVKDKDGKQAISARCWAHVYRYFEDAKHAEEAEADYALGLIKSLFHIDSFAFTLPEKECLALRQRLSKPIVEEFKTWLDAQNESAAPTSLLRAVKYTLGQWNGLVQFLNYGFVKLHNNDSENALRAIVLGRRNWLFAGSASGGKASAILMTLVQTCRRLRIDPEEYLEDVLRRMPGCTKKELEQFLPDRWKALKDAASTSNHLTEQTRCA
jgi:hypothetical protein